MPLGYLQLYQKSLNCLHFTPGCLRARTYCDGCISRHGSMDRVVAQHGAVNTWDRRHDAAMGREMAKHGMFHQARLLKTSGNNIS